MYRWQGGFILFWADDQPEQGSFHTNYKLDKDMEEIGLFDNAASGYALLDGFSYSVQSTDISYGRTTDGSAVWKFSMCLLLEAPTAWYPSKKIH
ncbi:MAG: hypothetical protein IPF68_14675 [Bacteroidales bacterium]|nr:hypothetical protein [Bacteroidales bacterium]